MSEVKHMNLRSSKRKPENNTQPNGSNNQIPPSESFSQPAAKSPKTVPKNTQKNKSANLMLFEELKKQASALPLKDELDPKKLVDSKLTPDQTNQNITNSEDDDLDIIKTKSKLHQSSIQISKKSLESSSDDGERVEREEQDDFIDLEMLEKELENEDEDSNDLEKETKRKDHSNKTKVQKKKIENEVVEIPSGQPSSDLIENNKKEKKFSLETIGNMLLKVMRKQKQQDKRLDAINIKIGSINPEGTKGTVMFKNLDLAQLPGSTITIFARNVVKEIFSKTEIMTKLLPLKPVFKTDENEVDIFIADEFTVKFPEVKDYLPNKRVKLLVDALKVGRRMDEAQINEYWVAIRETISNLSRTMKAEYQSGKLKMKSNDTTQARTSKDQVDKDQEEQ